LVSWIFADLEYTDLMCADLEQATRAREILARAADVR